jgi:aminoglycoside phosphotransferase (APT) family kinase protein
LADREYSKRLGRVSDVQLQAALDRFGLGSLNSAEPAEGGLFGQNVLLETTAGSFVFRGAPHWNPAGEDDWQFPKERFFSRLLVDSPAAPPVPWPYLVDQGRDIFGWGFAIQPRLPGKTYDRPAGGTLTSAECGQQAAALGHALAGIHTVVLPHPGRYVARSDTVEPLSAGYADYVRDTIEGLLQASRKASAATSESDLSWARTLVAGARPALELPFTPTVVHLDYGFHNVLLHKVAEKWEVGGVIDWMTAESGNSECDLARHLATDVQFKLGHRAEFMAAYRAVHLPAAGYEERFPVFVLWERLLIWSYWQRTGGQFQEGLGLRDWIEPFTNLTVA